MIQITRSTSASELIRQRAARMWVKTRNEGDRIVARVVPFGSEFNHRNKEKRVVEIDLLKKTAQCTSLETGEECAANSFGKVCSHVWRVLQQLAANQKKQARAN